MTDIFIMKLEHIQPSQLYVSSEKLTSILRDCDKFKPKTFEPLPVKRLRNDIILTDDHTIALAAFLRGASEIRVYWDDVESDWEAYQICVDWCKGEGIHSVADLENRVVPAEEFDLLWVKRCNQLAENLKTKRAAISFSIAPFENQEPPEPK
jgi:hypothetical protein